VARVKGDNLISEDLVNEMAAPSPRGLTSAKNSGAGTKLWSGRYAKAGLFVIDGKGKVQDAIEGKFLINPSTISESRAVNWAAKEVPGQSLPVYQWISSGARVITFDALITKDFGDSDDIFAPKNQDSEEVKIHKKFENVVASIASSFAGAIVNSVKNAPRQDLKQVHTAGIQRNLDYYRSLQYPTYSTSRKLRASPPLLAFYMGNSVSNGDREPALPDSTANKGINFDSEVWILTNLKINITKWFPDLTPMEATASFQLTQYNTRSTSREKIVPK
jgi:hypothetical protein